jgi:hypothetical protein
MNNYGKAAIAAIICILLGYAFGRYLQPAKIEIKREVEIKEVQVVKKDVVTVVHEVKTPDGTVTTDSRTEDRTTETTKTDTVAKESTSIENLKPQWRIQAGTDFKERALGPLYSIGVERRIIGPIFVGGSINMDKQAMLTVSMEL